MTILRRRVLSLLSATWILTGLPFGAGADTASCLEDAGLTRIARVRSAGGPVSFVNVVDHEGGVPTVVSPIGDGVIDLADAFRRARERGDGSAAKWAIAEDERSARICSPVRLPQAAIDAETHVVVAAGLNYAAHAEEAGGGDVFLFPKPVEPGAPYGLAVPPAGVTLLDYEVELAYVLLSDIDLANRPTREEFLAATAFFVANDVTDREAILVEAGFSGPGNGFVESKGQPTFLPAGPWVVRGTELFAALDACGASGLGIRLDVDEGEGFVSRQHATTEAMIVDPLALLDKIAGQIDSAGLRTPMSVERPYGIRHYPFAVQETEGAPIILPAGSIVVTGTPEGVAMQAPNVPGVVARGLVRLRGPFEQFRQEELARAARGESGGYLAAGDRVRASIDGLGTQIFQIAEPGASTTQHLCE